MIPLTLCLAGARCAVGSHGNKRKSLRNLAAARDGYARRLKSPRRVGAAPARCATLAQLFSKTDPLVYVEVRELTVNEVNSMGPIYGSPGV